MSDVLAKAEARRAWLIAELQTVDHFIRSYHSFAGAAAASSPIVRPRVRNPSKEEVAERVAEILRANGRPMMPKPLFDALTRSGITIAGQNPPAVMDTMMHRMRSKISRTPGVGYWIAGEEIPA